MARIPQRPDQTAAPSWWSRLYGRLFPSGPEEQISLAFWRERTINVFYASITAFTLLVYLPSLGFHWKAGNWLTVAGLNLGLLWCLAVLLLRRRLGYLLRARGAAAFCYLSGVSLLLELGPDANSMIYLFGFMIIAAVLLGAKAMILGMALNALALLTAGVLLHQGYLGWQVSWADPVSRWALIAFNFFVYTAMITLPVLLITKALKTMVVSSRNALKQLDREKDLLQREVEARTKAELVLAENQIQYQLLDDNLSDIILIVELAGMSTVYASNSVHRTLGHAQRPKAYPALADLFPRSSLDQIERLIGKAREVADSGAASPRDHRAELKARHANGATVWLDLALRLLLDENGRAESALIVGRDITTRKAAEKALLESEERYRATFEAMPDSVIISISDLKTGRYLEVSEGFVSRSGYARKEVIGKTARELGLTVDMNGEQRILDSLQSSGPVRSISQQYRDRAGRLVDLELTAKPLIYQGTQCVLVVAWDVTTLREAEAQRQQLQSQLFQSQKMEAVGTLAGGVAHDFNNILQVISSYTELLEADRGLAIDSMGHVHSIQSATDKAKAMVRRLLTFSRKVPTLLQPSDLNELVLQSTLLLRRAIPKMIDVQTRLSDGLWPIQADATQVNQVLLNLGANARDSMPEGGRLTFITDNLMVEPGSGKRIPELPPGPYVRLKVDDTGQGIAEKNLAHIFEPFFTTKELGRGTGLGLSIVFGIIEEHGGHIFCESRLGQGTTFSIYLPALPGHQVRGPVAAPAVEETDDKACRETLLLVDDEVDISQALGQALSMQGYQVMYAASGETALAVYEQHGKGIDLVVLDMGMPGMGGEACLEQLKLMDPEVRVVIATGYAPSEAIHAALGSGRAAFVPKPYRLKEMAEMIRSLLDKPTAD